MGLNSEPFRIFGYKNPVQQARVVALLLVVLVSSCASFHERDDAIYVGNPNDAQYDKIPESDWMKNCLAHQKPGGICIEGIDIRADRFDPVTVVGEKGDQYRFLVSWGWHDGRYGWVKKSDIAFPEDFKPVQDWKYQAHWDLCEHDHSCFHLDIERDGRFTANYTDSCSVKNVFTGKCPDYCPLGEGNGSRDCRDTGQVMTYGGVYQVGSNKWSIMIYLIPVPGKGLCWSDSWASSHDCTREH